MRHQVNANQLRRWMRLAQRVASPALPVVLPVSVEPAAPGAVAAIAGGGSAQAAAQPSIVIELGDAVVRVGSGARLAELRAVVQALRA